MDLAYNQNIFQDGDTWKCIFKKVNMASNTIEYETKGDFPTQEDAVKEYSIKMSAFQKDLVWLKKMTDIRFTFKEYLSYYYTEIMAPNSSETSTMNKYFWVIYRIVFSQVTKDILLRDITVGYIDNLIDQCAPYCECAEFQVYKALHTILGFAEKEGYIKKNFVNEIKKRSTKKPCIRIMTKDETQRFLKEAMQYESVYLEVLLALFCGLRTGEILGLRYSDFDSKNKCQTTISLMENVSFRPYQII